MALLTTTRRVLAAGALALLVSCSSADGADPTVVAPAGPDLPGSATLAAEAAGRASALCAAGADGLEPDPAAYRQETWADVAELVDRAELRSDDEVAGGGGEAGAEAAALGEIRAGWQGDGALVRSDWDRAETATVACADGQLYAVQVLARTPTRADAGDFGRLHLPADAIEHREGVVYRTAPDVDGRPVDLLLDLFLPPPSRSDDPAGRPTLVLVHGGGFATGSRAAHTDDALAYARLGFVVATIDYRVDPDAGDSPAAHRTASLAAVDDGMEAIRWLRGRSDELDVDPDRIAALGASAGGAIALGLALIEDPSPGDGPDADGPSQVAAAVSTGSYLTPVLGVTSLEADDAPVLLHHYESDTVTGRSWAYAGATCDAVRAVGVTCDLVVSEGEGHTIGLGPDSSETDRILAFLAVHLRLDG